MIKIDDSHILMYLDGVADLEIQTLIETNREYQIRVQELEKFQKAFSTHLYRVNCPNSLVMGEYLLKMLPHQAQKLLKTHFDQCPHCTSELREIEAFTRLSFVERVVARLIAGGKDDNQPEWIPEFGLRGNNSTLVYEAGGAQIAIDIQEDGEHIGYHSLIGLITGVDAQDYKVSLWRGGDQIGGISVNAIGNFSIDHLEPGEYELLIRGPKIEIQVQTFKI